MKKEGTPTPHNSASFGDFAKTVIMPGDPQRSKYIAENFLTDARLVNDVRGVQGYTGYYNGKKVSVMAHGMGMPSLAIYAHELYNFYGVESIIRIGTCGSISEKVKIKDIVVASPAVTESNIGKAFGIEKTGTGVYPSKDLLEKAKTKAKEFKLNLHEGIVLTSDLFYNEAEEANLWKEKGAVAVEMETFILYVIAKEFNKKALSILTSVDLVYDRSTFLPPEERQKSLNDMIKLALEVAE